jgi:hypothetical protein
MGGKRSVITLESYTDRQRELSSMSPIDVSSQDKLPRSDYSGGKNKWLLRNEIRLARCEAPVLTVFLLSRTTSEPERRKTTDGKDEHPETSYRENNKKGGNEIERQSNLDQSAYTITRDGSFVHGQRPASASNRRRWLLSEHCRTSSIFISALNLPSHPTGNDLRLWSVSPVEPTFSNGPIPKKCDVLCVT